MTDKITLGSIASFQNDATAVTQYNANNALITTALDNTLSRDGTSPNQMGSTLDMNSNQIINLPAPTTKNSPLRLVDVVSNPSATFPATGTSGHVVPFLDGVNIWSGTNLIDGNSVTSITPPVTLNSTALLGIIGVNNSNPGLWVDSFGAVFQPFICLRNANGTATSKTATTATGPLGQYRFGGYDGTAYGDGIALVGQSVNSWTLSDHGTTLDFYLTPVNSTSLTLSLRMQASGGVSIGTTTDPGVGSLILNGSLLHPTVANAAIATVLGSVGPAGSHTTVQEWFPIKNSSGVVRYVPGF